MSHQEEDDAIVEADVEMPPLVVTKGPPIKGQRSLSLLQAISKFTDLGSLPNSSESKGTKQSNAATQATVLPKAKYSVHVVEDVLKKMFKERRGDFPATSSSCHVSRMPWPPVQEPEPHVDKRLRYWKEVLQQRRRMQERVQRETGKLASEVLFNRRSTLDNRDEQTLKRVLDYADRMESERLQVASVTPVPRLADLRDPCTCQSVPGLEVTAPRAEQAGYKVVEIIGLPEVSQRELLGRTALEQKPPNGWLQSEFLDERLEQKLGAIENVVEFFPDINALQVTGTGVDKLKPRIKPTVLVETDSMHTVTKSDSTPFCSEECICESSGGAEDRSTEVEPAAPVPELGLRVNGVDYVPGETGIRESYEVVTRFTCDPFRRRVKHVLELTNIGLQTLSFSWKQSTYFYNRGSLLLAQDNEFHFDLDGFRLTHGESRSLVVLYQPRKVTLAVELWLLQVEPRIFCGRHESLLLRLHGRCTPPADYMAKLLECQCACICKSDELAMDKLTAHLGDLVPLVVPPPTCCPYARVLDDRESFNNLNPGYSCVRFDDLEVLRALHQRLKKPREPPWDLTLATIRSYILRVEELPEREQLFAEFTGLLAPLMTGISSLDPTARREGQKERSRLIYVRGVICNGIAEWEALMLTVEESFFKPELQRFYQSLMAEQDEEEEDEAGNGDQQPQPRPIAPIDEEKLLQFLEEAELSEDEIRAEVRRKLYHSKYFRDALYIQTYSHLCNMAEDIVSVIESTEVEPA